MRGFKSLPLCACFLTEDTVHLSLTTTKSVVTVKPFKQFSFTPSPPSPTWVMMGYASWMWYDKSVQQRVCSRGAGREQTALSHHAVALRSWSRQGTPLMDNCDSWGDWKDTRGQYIATSFTAIFLVDRYCAASLFFLTMTIIAIWREKEAASTAKTSLMRSL